MSITKAFIIHGTGGSPQGNWFPWLKAELEKLKIHVFIPQLPTGEKQSLSSWMTEFQIWGNGADEDAIMVGHSLGGAFILNFLEKSNSTVAAAFLVAPFIGKLNLPDFDSLIGTFTEKEFNWNRIRSRCKEFFIYSSDNDPYVPLEKGEYLSRKLHSKFRIIRNAGHINADYGYTRFEPLLNDIRHLIAP